MSNSGSLDHVDQLIRDAKAGEIPRHVAIIMDGNGRWAQNRDLPRIEGHRRGVSTVRMVSEVATELGVDTITLYCLSSENWKRPQGELDFLMHLLEQYMIEERSIIMKQNIVVEIIGRRKGIPSSTLAEMDKWGVQIAKCGLSEKGIEAKFINGLRYTDADTVKVVDEVLSRQVNGEVCEMLQIIVANL